MAKEITDKDFEQEVIKSDIPVLIDFWAPWCGPCQVMGPIIDNVSKEYEGKVKVLKMNVDENPETSQKFGIMSIPTMKIFKDGQPVKDLIGVQSEELIKKELEAVQ